MDTKTKQKIEREVREELRREAKKRMRLIAMLTLLVFLSGAFTAWRYVPRIKTIVETVGVPLPKKSFRTLLLEEAKINGIPAPIALAVWKQESLEGKQQYAFEESKMPFCRKTTPTENEARMCASSHGHLHIMGYTAREMGVAWPELYIEEVNAAVGMKHLRECKEAAERRKLQKTSKWRWALACQNGGQGWIKSVSSKQAMANNYANAVLSYAAEGFLDSQE